MNLAFVSAPVAHQHLNTEGKPVSLCGLPFDDMDRVVKVYDYRDGFDPKGGPACKQCTYEALVARTRV